MPINTIYDKIGVGYNRTRTADPYITERLFYLLAPVAGNTYLDVGCGTGNYTNALAKKGVRLTGIDPSERMLEIARASGTAVQWLSGAAENIPLPANTADGAIATLTIHHWPDLEKGSAELARVLKTGSRAVIFTFTKEQERGYWFNYFFPGMMQKTFQNAVTSATTRDAAAKAGFTLSLTEKYFVAEDIQDMFGYSGKHNPEVYSDPAIRNGISSFSLLADEKEVETGLKKLRECIDSGQFISIKEQYDNDDGDYQFIVFTKM